ncbi:hypothetical protein FocTR4_00017238 [Fusarium oxysporum f. sp. cubense]|uniref:Ent-kaurene oxidase n=1 Tax=Fusarium oxysporum f. sp. cubense TaxID=61366 RepID=A0A5C6TPW4_FUSOC|nr:hypothetical protein FocTR4_00017238 [Fusarium oxysporum f. sp. cubense]
MNETIANNALPWESSPRWQLIATCSAIFGLALSARAFFQPNDLSNFPAVGKGSLWARRKQYASGSAWELYEEGYRMQIKKGADYFRIATTAPAETVVVSSKFLAELKRLPDDVMSMSEAISEVIILNTGRVEDDELTSSLTPASVRLNPMVSQEVHDAMALELPQTKDWTEVNINEKVLRIIAMASGRVVVGPELCRNEQYLDAVVNYNIDVMTAAYIVALVPQWIRPFVAPFLPYIKRLDKRLKDATSLLRSVITTRQEAAGNLNTEKPDDMLQWLIDAQSAEEKVDIQKLAEMQLSAIFAAIHTTSLVTTNAEDVEQALATSNGEFINLPMQNMKKLDSFLEEILRFHTLGAGSFKRKVLKPFNLSNGQHIPAGVYLELPAGGIAYDEDIFPDPKTFDALRFYKLRQSKTRRHHVLKRPRLSRVVNSWV